MQLPHARLRAWRRLLHPALPGRHCRGSTGQQRPAHTWLGVVSCHIQGTRAVSPVCVCVCWCRLRGCEGCSVAAVVLAWHVDECSRGAGCPQHRFSFSCLSSRQRLQHAPASAPPPPFSPPTWCDLGQPRPAAAWPAPPRCPSRRLRAAGCCQTARNLVVRGASADAVGSVKHPQVRTRCSGSQHGCGT
jgi:hypothetical protein